MIHIEKNVPMPAHRCRGAEPKYPFAKMAIGDSITVPFSVCQQLYGAAAQWKRRHPGWNYTTRTESPIASEGGVCKQVRLWRTA